MSDPTISNSVQNGQGLVPALPGPRPDPSRGHVTSPFGGIAQLRIGTSTGVVGSIVAAGPLIAAEAAITAKAVALGNAGPPVGDVESVGNGFFRRFANDDIYFSPATDAHEVHGAIREKYGQLGGAGGVLGYPLTDEQVINDANDPGVPAAFNHFEHGSITGPGVSAPSWCAARSATCGPPRAGRWARSASPSPTSTAMSPSIPRTTRPRRGASSRTAPS